MSTSAFSKELWGKNLREKRLEQRMTPPELAARAAVSVSYLGRLERGEQVPRVDVALRLAWALGVDVARLFELPRRLTVLQRAACSPAVLNRQWRLGAGQLVSGPTIKEA